MKSVTHLIRVCYYFTDLAEIFALETPGGGKSRAQAPHPVPLYFFILFFFLRFRQIIEKRYENSGVEKLGPREPSLADFSTH